MKVGLGCCCGSCLKLTPPDSPRTLLLLLLRAQSRLLRRNIGSPGSLGRNRGVGMGLVVVGNL